MSDITTMPGNGSADDPTAQAAPERNDPGDDNTTDWKAKSRLWESRAKENADAAKKLKQIEDAAKTTEQIQAEKITALEAQLRQVEQTRQLDSWMTEVSSTTGIPASALRGSTLEEIQSHAAAIAEYVANVTKPKSVPSEGQPRTTPSPSDEQQFINQLFS